MHRKTEPLIENKQIESIGKLDNGHILLVVKEESRMQLTSFRFDDNIKYTDAFYMAKGWLELHDMASLKIFLNVNKRHLSEELSKNILQEAEKLILDPNASIPLYPRLSLFQKTQEKIPLKRLHKIKCWSETFYNSKKWDTSLSSIFSDIFMIIFPPEKWEKIPGSPFVSVFESEGNILVQPAKDQIGTAYKQLYDFLVICGSVAAYPSYPDSFPQLAREPEVLGKKWDVLNDDDSCLQILADWVKQIIISRINPLYDTSLSDASVERLQNKLKIILQAIDELKLAPEQTVSQLPAPTK